MDANGTRFHLLLGQHDWSERATTESGMTLHAAFTDSDNGLDADFSWDDKRKVLTLGKRVFSFTPSTANVPAELSNRRGAAADMYGNVYWIAENGTEILVNSAGSRTTTRFWSALCRTSSPACPPPQAAFRPPDKLESLSYTQLSGLAVTTLHYLVVGTLGPAGLLVFDLHRGGDPRQLVWPVPFAPFDFARTKDGGLWILDAANKRAWRLDRTMGVVPVTGSATPPPPELFQSLDGDAPAPPIPPATLNIGMARALSASDPVAIEALDDDSILILNAPPADAFSTIIRINPDGTTATASLDVAKNIVEPSKRATFTLRGHDFLYVQQKDEHLLYVAGSNGDQAIAFEMNLASAGLVLTAVAEFYPMRLFGAKALIAAADGPMYDAQDRWVPLIEQKRPRYAESATFYVLDLDGKQPDCVWHRLLFDACIPADCDIVVSSRASNDRDLVDLLDWRDEQPLVRRPHGSELAWTDDAFRAGIDTWELLFQEAKGQYLQLRVTLTGTGRNSPRVRAMRAWYPRFSYLQQYLPSAYRENAESASFLDRFLANIEGIATTLEDRVAAAQVLLDPRAAPPQGLDWLASFFDVALDPVWSERRRRAFVARAMELFRWRGTIPGLRMALRLVSDQCVSDATFSLEAPKVAGPRIVEKFRTRNLPGVLVGDTSETTPAGLPLRLVTDEWTPAAGAADLNRRWSEAMSVVPSAVEGPPSAGDASTSLGMTPSTYPITAPSDPATRTTWTEFSRTTLGFVPRATSADTALWQESLQRRYVSISDLSRQWHVSYTDWSQIALPTQLPTLTAPLRDWVYFEGQVLAAKATAHRFTVFLPQANLEPSDRDKKLELAKRVVSLEKPAHTDFEVKFFWAFFRVGEARLGEDTIVDLGSRSPELLGPFILDRNYLGSGYLGPQHTGCGCVPPSTTGGSR